MWEFSLLALDRQTVKGAIVGKTRPLSFREVIDLWQNNAPFRTEFTKTICGSSFDAFFWETPPVTISTLDQTFEFVLVEGSSLSHLQADPKPFRSHFSAANGAPVLTFPNLGGDAVLVVPSPLADHSTYTHLARFLRTGSAGQVAAFWQQVGVAMKQRISSQPTWLSTAGMGVSWLHLRLDSHPKYYRHEPYRR